MKQAPDVPRNARRALAFLQGGDRQREVFYGRRLRKRVSRARRAMNRRLIISPLMQRIMRERRDSAAGVHGGSSGQ